MCSLTHDEIILRVLEAALGAVEPYEAVRAHVTLDGNMLRMGASVFDLSAIDRVIVVGGGKAGTPMTASLTDILGSHVTTGTVNVKHGHLGVRGSRRVRIGRELPAPEPPDEPRGGDALPHIGPVQIVEAGHPVPDESGLAGATRIAGMLQNLSARDLVIVLLSGGGSALLPLPSDGITLTDLQVVTQQLLRCGADITEMNAVRKHCSRLAGGQLARLAHPAQVVTLILSDVVGSPLDSIASGPTVPDPTTFADALAVLDRYAITPIAPECIVSRFRQGSAGLIMDTPKAGDPIFDRVSNVIVGDNLSAARSAADRARELGLNAHLLTAWLQGEAREVARVVAGIAQGIASGQSDIVAPACVVLGGETTVTLRGNGRGGRNQELALAAGLALSAASTPPTIDIAIVSLATDGTDGPTNAAGGIGRRNLLRSARSLQLDPIAALQDNDSYSLLQAVEQLLITGPTNTNVNDLVFAFIFGPDD